MSIKIKDHQYLAKLIKELFLILWGFDCGNWELSSSYSFSIFSSCQASIPDRESFQ